MSTMSLPIFGYDLELGKNEVTFTYADDDKNPTLMMESIDLPSMTNSGDYRYTFKLAEGYSEIQKAMNSVQLMILEAYIGNPSRRSTIKETSSKMAKPRTLFVSPKYTELLAEK